MTASQHLTEFAPNPMQKQFIESRAKADLFSSRRGEGKSTALAWACMYHTRHNPGASWAIIRDTWENMQATTMKTFFEWFPPGVYGDFVASKKQFIWAEGIAKGDVTFMGMDDPNDSSKLMSRELGGMGIDEPAPAVGSVGIDEMIFDVGFSSLRQQGMEWYPMKLAENNPDETHWTYRRFVRDQNPDFLLWQPPNPENLVHLPATYYEDLRRQWKHRPDLVRRFVAGEFGFQSIGKAVTPQWSDRIHLALGLIPVDRQEIVLLWDFGHTPVCLITQKTPMGQWLILDALVGENVGVVELIEDAVHPLLESRYQKNKLWHIGDPSGREREQTSIRRSAVRYILESLGGKYRPGPIKPWERVDPLQRVLTRTTGGLGVVQVDRERAMPVWHALRGGWHHHVARTGIISGEPAKTHPDSDVGDAMGYGAAILFPLHKHDDRSKGREHAQAASYFGAGSRRSRIGPDHVKVPYKHGAKMTLPPRTS